jgi:hypothetical protein
VAELLAEERLAVGVWPSFIGPSFSALMPYWVTMSRAVAVALAMSLDAPVVKSPIVSSSATRPPSIIASWSMSSPRDTRYLSSVGSDRVQPSADAARGMIDTLWTGSACGSACPTIVCPPSW